MLNKGILIRMILIVVIAGLIIYLLSPLKTSEPSTETADEFKDMCILKQGECSYSFLLFYLDKNPDTKDTQVKAVLMEKYETVKVRYANKQINEKDFSEDAGLLYVLKIINILNAKEREFWFGKFLGMNKTTWLGTHLQVYYLRSIKNYTTIDDVKLSDPDLQKLLSGNICNILPTIKDVTGNPSSDIYTCNLYDYMEIKFFCKSILTEDEKSLLNDVLVQNYTDPLAINCHKMLSIFNSML